MANKRYYASLEVKKDMLRCSAKNKTEARKKISKRLAKRLANGFVKIDYIEEDCGLY